MSKKFKILLTSMLVVSLLTAGLTGTVLAQDDGTDDTTAPDTGCWPGRMFGGGRGSSGQAGMEAIAEALGLTAKELSTQLWGGKTLAELAEKAGIDLQALRDAATAAQMDAVREAIQQAVEDGDISQEQADWLIEGLDNGYWGGHRFGGWGGFGGRGHSHGRFGGRGFFGAPDSSDDAQEDTAFGNSGRSPMRRSFAPRGTDL